MTSLADNLPYFRIAAAASTYPDGETGRKKPWDTGWFYGGGDEDRPALASEARLNALCRAYLGDETAQMGLSFGEAAEGEVHAGMLEGRFGLNDRQRLAVRRALESDISLVQGPPGTGKTETILNMVSCMLGRGATVAVVSTNREALANITKKVAGYEGALKDTEPNRWRLHRSYAALGNFTVRKGWSAEHPDCPRFSTNLKTCRNAALGCGGWEPKVRAAGFLAHRPFITSTIHSLKKCFADGDTYQFDYVIMDEASQCSPSLALIAMSSARHLVLVGDVEQLPPVFQAASGATALAAAEHEGVRVPAAGSPYAMQDALTGDGMSILASARAVLEPHGMPHTFLNEHFRCHPGIISFCSEAVYEPRGEGLIVRTPDYDRNVQTPIRIRWFEGNYWEPHRLADGGETASAADEAAPDAEETRDDAESTAGDRCAGQVSKENRKQVEIFMREEWPQLRARLHADPEFSVRIVSPFRGQLLALHDRLVAEVGADEVELLFPLAGEGQGDDRAPRGDDGQESWQRTGLTIHKTQGQEYNVVYLLPVEDGDWDWPWSQGKSLINVATSRAKDELVVICSADLMSKRTQLALTGTYIPPSAGAAPTRLTPEERARREERERFLQKLIDYVRDRTDPASTAFTGEVGFPASAYAYGFHRSGLDSIFDQVPAIRSHVKSDESSAELALCDALGDVDLAGRGLAAARNVPLSRCFPNIEQNRRLTDGDGIGIQRRIDFVLSAGDTCESHFDLVIYDRTSRRLVLCIEVDGGQHRYVSPADKTDSEDKLAYRKTCYRIKDAIARDMGARVLEGNDRLETRRSAGAGPFTFTMLRLATNGTTALETEHLAARCDADSPLARTFTTIEELIDMQLEFGTPAWPSIDPSLDLAPLAMPTKDEISGAVRRAMKALTSLDETRTRTSTASDDARSISKLLRDWKDDGLISGRLTARRANEALRAAGMIEKREDGWVATQRGQRLGVIERIAESDGGRRTYCCYPPSCEAGVLDILRAANTF